MKDDTDYRQRFEDFQLCSSNWLCETDPEGRYTYVSDSVRHILDFEPEEIIGKNVLELVIEKDQPRVRKRLEKELNNSQRKKEYYKRVRAKNGEIRLMHCTFIPIEGPVGELKGFRSINSDVTRVFELQEKLQIKDREVRELRTALRVVIDIQRKDETPTKESSLPHIKQSLLYMLKELERDSSERQKEVIGIIRDKLHFLSEDSTELTIGLNVRELKIAQFVMHGYTSKEIGDMLGMSPRTVDNYRQSIRKKLHINHSSRNLRNELIELLMHKRKDK